MARELATRIEEDFIGWCCSECGWFRLLGGFAQGDDKLLPDMTQEFEAHDCAEYPRKDTAA
jgi:hypothetical protein